MPDIKRMMNGGKLFYFDTPPVHPTGVSVSGSASFTAIGQTAQLTATVQPEDADFKKVTWCSLDETKAKVSKTGLVTSTGKGNTKVYAIDVDGHKSSCIDVSTTVTYTAKVLLVGGGGGGGCASTSAYASGGGGGGGVIDREIGFSSNSLSINIGTGGAQGVNGGNTYAGTMCALGGRSGSGYDGGNSGSGCLGCKGYPTDTGGGGGGAGGNAVCNPKGSYWYYGGNGGKGVCLCGYVLGGGGGGGQDYYNYCEGCKGCGCDGGGDGGWARDASKGSGCNATTYGSGGGGATYGGNGGKGCQGLAIICYKKDGSCGFSNATGGAITEIGDYKVHTFYSNGTFCILPPVWNDDSNWNDNSAWLDE